MQRVVDGTLLLALLVNRPFSLSGHDESQENKKLCFCMVSLAQTRIQCEANRAKTKRFILMRLNMAAESERSKVELFCGGNHTLAIQTHRKEGLYDNPEEHLQKLSLPLPPGARTLD